METFQHGSGDGAGDEGLDWMAGGIDVSGPV